MSKETSKRMLIPNSFQTPNLIVDDLLPYLKGTELKVLLFLMRKTFGWQKKSDRISLSQFEKGTGVGRANIVEALKQLRNCNLILRKESTKGDVYWLNLEWDFEENIKWFQNRTGSKIELVSKQNQSGSKIEPESGSKIEPTETKYKPTYKKPLSGGSNGNGKLDYQSYKEKVKKWFVDNKEMLKKDYFELWEETYPNVSVPTVVNQAYTWLLSNPEKQRSQFVRYLNGCLGKAQKEYNEKHTR